MVVPSTNETEPKGTAPLLLVTAAVNVTDCPGVAGLEEEATVVVVDACVMDCDRAAEVLVAKVAFPEYCAVME